MHPITMIAQSLKQDDPDYPVMPDYPVKKEVCCFTGETTDCIQRKNLIGKSFNNHDALLRPGSQWVSLEAWKAMKYKWERASSFWCDGNDFKRLDRVGVRNKFLNYDMPDLWIGYATTSYKKHGSFLVKPNMSKKSHVWSFEMKIVDASDRERTEDWWNMLNKYIRLGISRPVMETLAVNPAYIKLFGLDVWLEFESWAKDKYQSNLYAFLCYLLPSQEELKKEKKEAEAGEVPIDDADKPESIPADKPEMIQPKKTKTSKVRPEQMELF